MLIIYLLEFPPFESILGVCEGTRRPRGRSQRGRGESQILDVFKAKPFVDVIDSIVLKDVKV